MSGFGNFAFGQSPFGAIWSNPNSPNLPDFIVWVYQYMKVPLSALPADSPWPGYVFPLAQSFVPFFPGVASIDFVLTTYNCAGHILIESTPDQPGSSFFDDTRKDFRIMEPVIWIVQSSSDEGTSNSFAIGEGMHNLTIADLEFYRTPYGRKFLNYAQSSGPGIWGLS